MRRRLRRRPGSAPCESFTTGQTNQPRWIIQVMCHVLHRAEDVGTFLSKLWEALTQTTSPPKKEDLTCPVLDEMTADDPWADPPTAARIAPQECY